MMIPFACGFLLGLITVSVIGGLAFRRQQELYESVFRVLENARDEARHEAQVFRRLVLPVYDKAENPAPTTAPTTEQRKVENSSPGPATQFRPLNPIFNRRIPWRIRWKAAAKDANTKQKGTDALAAALSVQQTSAQKVPQEKTHV